jgi:hypothetical protein
MSVSAIGQRLLGIPPLSSQRSLGEDDRARRKRISRRLLRLGIALLIIVLLLGVMWVEPVT